jgi:phospholipid/cholesterol/gamma-HCH transport system substrate-binding protein
MSPRAGRATALKIGVLTVLAALLSGCGVLNLKGAPLPGGADLGNKPYKLTAQFRDVEDLVPQAAVRVNNVPIGEVESIALDKSGWLADVHLKINNSVQLPANATAELRQTTLLGEKYVELFYPKNEPPRGQLHDGSVIPVTATTRPASTEEIFGALSMLLNGGGVNQVRNIAIELNKALNGHEADTRALLDDLNRLVGTLDGQKGNITRALDGLDRLSASLVGQRQNLDEVLVQLEPGLRVLNEQRPQLVGLLRALDRLSDVATHVVNRSHDDLVHDLYALRPTLRELARTGDDLPKSLQVLVTVPFVDSAVGDIRGAFMNLDVQLDLIPTDISDNLANASTLRQQQGIDMLPPSLRKLIPERSPRPPSMPGFTTSSTGASDAVGGLTGLFPGLGGNR